MYGRKVIIFLLIISLFAVSCENFKAKIFHKKRSTAVTLQPIKKAGFVGSADALFHYNLATVLYNKHKYLASLSEFRKALTLNPTNEISLKSKLIIASIYDRIGKYDDSVLFYEKAIAVGPNNLKAHYNLGTVFMKTQKFSEAVKQFQLALKINSSDLESMINLGNSFLNLKNYEAAIGIYLKAIAANPKMPDITYNLAYAYQEGGYFDKAIKTYEQVIKIDKTRQISKLVYINMGSIYDERGEYDKAILSYRRGLALSPENTDLRFNLSLALLKKHKRLAALKELKKIISEKKDADAFLTMGNIYYDLKKYGAAKKYLTKAIQEKPNAKALLFLANIYFKESNYQMAKKYYEKIIQKEKTTDTSRLAYIGLGNISDNQKDYIGAIENYQQAIKLMPTDAGLHYNIAVIMIKAKKIQAATDELKQALSLDPSDFNALKLISNVVYNLGRTDKSLSYVKRALKLQPADFDLTYLSANIYLKKGLSSPALKNFMKSLKLSPTQSQKKVVFVNIGNIYSSDKKYNIAVKYYQNSIAIDPRYSTAYYNLALTNYHLGKISTAINNLLETIKYEPTNIDAHSLLGNLYYKKGMLDLAEQEYKTAIELGSRDISLLDNLKKIKKIKR